MDDKPFYDKYTTEPINWITLEKGPFLKPIVQKTNTNVTLKIIESKIVGKDRSKVKVLVKNIGKVPAFMTKIVTGSPLQLDVSGNFLIQDKLTLGVAYRWDAAVSALAGFQITDGLFIGYGYDLETTKLRRYNSGSHEIFLRFELFNKYSKMVSPRFF